MKHSGSNSGFTLLELLVVVALISAFAFVVLGGLSLAGQSGALKSGQAALSNIVTAARIRAVSTGKRTRILLPVNPSDDSRFLAVVVLQTVRDPNASPLIWDTITKVVMPDGVYVSPRDPAAFPALLPSNIDWRRRSTSSIILGSSLFDGASLMVDLHDGQSPTLCEGVAFTERGTLAKIDGTGWALPTFPPAVVLFQGRRQNLAQSQSPVQFENPDAARGLFVSVYGVPALINARSSF